MRSLSLTSWLLTRQGSSYSDPTPFFKAVLANPWGANIVLSPHIYPPSVTQQTMAQDSGSGLFNRLTSSFGSYTLKVRPSDQSHLHGSK